MRKSQIDICMDFFHIGVEMAGTRKKLEEEIFQACLESAKKMGYRLGDLSWFGKNHNKEKKMTKNTDGGTVF